MERSYSHFSQANFAFFKRMYSHGDFSHICSSVSVKITSKDRDLKASNVFFIPENSM